MTKYLIYIIIIGVSLLSLPSVAKDEYVYTDAAVKAAYVLNISHFVSFPAGSEPIELCIIGDDLIGISIANQQTRNPDLYKTLKISKRTSNGSFEKCSIVYISAQRADQLGNILYKIEKLSVLTISDIVSFAQKGGMIELAVVQSKVQIYINQKTVKAHDVKLSSKLLGFAKQVYEE